MTKDAQMGVVMVSWPILKFCVLDVFEMGEVGYLNLLCRLIFMIITVCMIDYPRMGCSGSRGIFKF